MILVMSVVPGFTGQAFMPEVLAKSPLPPPRAWPPPKRLEIDGGIGIRTAHQALEAGADVLVAGAAVFRNPERGADDQAAARRLSEIGNPEPLQMQLSQSRSR